ncbi:MAG: hypothetical protein JNJ73_11215 [Hyphomonadaceae bacterium]|nr:hypothetical protein [Hyphomonadaceae bacterium]
MAISSVFTIAGVAQMPGEDEDWRKEIVFQLDPEDGCLLIWRPGEEATTAFSERGVESLQELIAELRRQAQS